MNKLVKL